MKTYSSQIRLFITFHLNLFFFSQKCRSLKTVCLIKGIFVYAMMRQPRAMTGLAPSLMAMKPPTGVSTPAMKFFMAVT